METLTTKDIYKIAIGVVKDVGETHSYPPNKLCRYVKNSAPSCFVGHILHRLGVSITHLVEIDESTNKGFMHAYLAGKVPVPLTPAAAHFLEGLQEMQDMNEIWSDILSNLETRYGLS